LAWIGFSAWAKADWDALRVGTDDQGVRIDWNPTGSHNGLGDRVNEVKLKRRVVTPDFRDKQRWPNGVVLIESGAGDLPQGTTQFLDATIEAGTRYEYSMVFPSGSNGTTKYTMTFSAGHEVALRDDMGRILLVVEEGLVSPLEKELARLEMDLIGDGWEVTRITHERDPGFPELTGVPASQETLRAKIMAAYEENPDDTTALLLIGRLPIVMSGNISPDGHSNRPHMTDQFYGDMDGTWTDTAHLRDPVGSNGAAQNIPGDGRYDHNIVPGDGAELQVGRVDMAGFSENSLTQAGKTELGMTRNYLRKNHVFRSQYIEVPNEMVDSQWQYGKFERYQAQMLTNNRVRSSYKSLDGKGPFLIGVGFMNPGNDLVTLDFPMVFHHNHKSYVQELWKSNNPHRAVIASEDYSLTAVMGGWYPWILHPMGMGATIGESFLDGARYLRSDRSTGMTEGSSQYIFLNLVGDPSLRLYPVGKPESITLSRIGANNLLHWSPPNETNVVGYHVYRSANRLGPYERLTTNPVTETTFTDTGLNGVTYMVRTIKRQAAKTGSFYQASQGVFAEIQADETILRAPVANDQQGVVSWGEARVDTLAVSDADGDQLLLDLAEKPRHGTVSLNGTQYTFTPDGDYAGVDHFSYSAFDGLNSVEATVEITIESGPVAPVALDDTFEFEPGVNFDSGVASVLDNDSDLNEDALTAVLVDDSSHGTLTLRTDGSFTYTPGPSFDGQDTFTYRAHDGGLQSDPATVTLSVTLDNLALNATIESVSDESSEDGHVAIKLLDGINDTDHNRWSAKNYPQSVEIDLGEDFLLRRFDLHTYSARGYQYTVATKSEGGAYTEVIDRSANSTRGNPISDDFPDGTTARFVRLTITDGGTYNGDWVSIREVEIYGQPAPPTTPQATWAEAMGLDPLTNAGMNDDANGDGKPNFYHFAFAENPLDSNGAPGQRQRNEVIQESTVSHLTLTLPFRLGTSFSGDPPTSAPIDGLIYIIHGDQDLAPPWGDLPVVERTPARSEGLPSLDNLDASPGPDWEYRTFDVELADSEVGFIWVEVREAP